MVDKHAAVINKIANSIKCQASLVMTPEHLSKVS
uniref:Uncharacterized protein n=1 Tax=Medicago truncatula TaxID=3880 RepID=A2Q2C8_MEDTR|nr:hypothetical protein MtrDRAFT_AC150244g33v2 [Medicago truncatula]